MKRSPLTRKTPLKRSKPLRRMSAAKRLEIKTHGPARKAYRKEMKYCCATGNLASEVHEIFGAGLRTQTVGNPAFWLPVCRVGHVIVQHESRTLQLARKLLCDPERFDLDEINRVVHLGRPGITLADIVRHLRIAE